MPPVIVFIATASFAAALSQRAIDPVLPAIAADLSVTIATAAGLSAALAFTFAITQPVLGAAADLFGKSRLMIGCLVLLAIANLLGAMATSYPLLLASRILCGIATGGVFPVTLSLTADLVEPAKRQVAISRVLVGAMSGNLLGASLGGIAGDFVGWRGVLLMLSGIALIASMAVLYGLNRSKLIQPAGKPDIRKLVHGYGLIFANPNTRVIYSAVFVEGCFVMGMFPFLASFLLDLGVTSLSIAGIVLSGFAMGGLLYTLSVGRMLKRFGTNKLMIAGGVIMGSQLVLTGLGPSWPVQMGIMLIMGWAFYLLHGSLQVFSSELSEEARASAMSLHACSFFLGQTVGPLAYGFGVHQFGKQTTLLIAGVIVATIGFACVKWLTPIRPAPVATTV